MAKVYIRAVRLGKWFPPNDALAVQIARLCILREDLMLQLHGLHAERIKALDLHSTAYRRTYFLRSAVRTMWEIQGANTVIRSNPAFKKMLAKCSPGDQRKLKEITRKLNAAAPLVQRLRNALGGHVDTDYVAIALKEMEWERFGFLEVGARIKETHYQFAGELVAEMLVPGVPPSERFAQLEKDMVTIAGLLPIVQALELIIATYAEARDLI